MNIELSIRAVQEVCRPSFAADGDAAVGFFMAEQYQFCIKPTDPNETYQGEAALDLAQKFWDLMTICMTIYGERLEQGFPMSTVLAVTVAQEFCMPAVTAADPKDPDSGNTWAVAFFKDNVQQFCIPVETQEQALLQAARFQELFVAAIQRYEQLQLQALGAVKK